MRSFCDRAITDSVLVIDFDSWIHKLDVMGRRMVVLNSITKSTYSQKIPQGILPYDLGQAKDSSLQYTTIANRDRE